FFFSSRRRHTRCYRDWSSDVCSSDLGADEGAAAGRERARSERSAGKTAWPTLSLREFREVFGPRLWQTSRRPHIDNGAGDPPLEIGRASCRERERIPGKDAALREQNK